jgi:ubiquinone/menaquinone biosynthesis C-methylase UbiE
LVLDYDGFSFPPMPAPVDLYNNAYGHYEAEVYRRIRTFTYGQDFGQTSWVSNEESNEIPGLLGLTSHSRVLEIGSGSGRYALSVAESIGCEVLGLDVNELAVENANRLAADAGMSDRVRFQTCDVSKPLPFESASFDAVFSNDVICHIPNRLALLRELNRILKPGSKLLFSDALVIGGTISHQEIATRSSIGYYLFSPPGENERQLTAAGFSLLYAKDTTANAAGISTRWRQGRENSKDELTAIEGAANFEGLQRFLSCVHTLTSERRLLRYFYLAQKN